MSSSFDNYSKAAEEFNYYPDEAVREDFSQKLQALRHAIGVSQAEFSERIGISRQALSMYEKGERVPDICILNRIVEVTGCSFNYLLGPQESMVDRFVSLSEETGLSDNACHKLYSICSSDAETLELLLSSDSFWKLIAYITYARRGGTLNNEAAPMPVDYFRFKTHCFVDALIQSAEAEACEYSRKYSRDHYLIESRDLGFDYSIDQIKSDRYGELDNLESQVSDEWSRLSNELKETLASIKSQDDEFDEFAQRQTERRLQQINNDKFENFKAKLHRYGPYKDSKDN